MPIPVSITTIFTYLTKLRPAQLDGSRTCDTLTANQALIISKLDRLPDSGFDTLTR